MPQLRDDLPRRLARYRGADRGKDFPSGPPRQVAETAGLQRVDPVFVDGRRARAIERRDDEHDVDGDVDPAGDARDLFGRQPARVVGAIREGDDRAARTATARRESCPSRRWRRRATWRRRAQGLELLEDVPGRRSERLELLESAVEGEEPDLVFAFQPAEQVKANLARSLALDRHVHAAAEVHEQRDAHRRRLGAEVDDLALLARVEQLKVGFLELRDRPSLTIADDGGDGDALDDGLERRALLLRRLTRRRRLGRSEPSESRSVARGRPPVPHASEPLVSTFLPTWTGPSELAQPRFFAEKRPECVRVTECRLPAVWAGPGPCLGASRPPSETGAWPGGPAHARPPGLQRPAVRRRDCGCR